MLAVVEIILRKVSTINMKDNNELSAEVLESAIDYLPRLINGLTKASVYFNNDKPLEGYQILYDANEGLMWFNQVVQSLPILLPQGENAIEIENKWEPYLAALNSMLSSIENKDEIAISQTLENEIVPYIELVYQKINNLRRVFEYKQ
ncbi:MAG: hypothetical protein A4E53_02125 [Pelotomaculum sp. PtaB.Bin104]|nr:MAG: hypothetical protein A4E53_02125 [Pelotomaculum sp. PtaB.Bin104]